MMNLVEHMTKIIKLMLRSMLNSSLCDYSNAFIIVKGTITVASTTSQDQPNIGGNKKVILKNCVPCVNRINNRQADHAHDIDIIMMMYNVIEYSDNYSKTSGFFWQYRRYEPALAVYGTIADFTA